MIKKSSRSGTATPNYQLANELHKQITRKFKKRKVISSFRDDILGVDLTDIQSLSMYNKAINTTKESKEYLICAFDVFIKYAWVVSLKDKRGISIIDLFQKIISK